VDLLNVWESALEYAGGLLFDIPFCVTLEHHFGASSCKVNIQT
jgi:hypothetical protein